MCSFKHAHIFINPNEKMCLKALRSKHWYDFYQEIHIWFLLKTSDFLSFALISSDESQSKAQFNTLSLGKNKTDVYCVRT